MPALLFLAGWAFVFGLVLGSFLNVCIYRLPRECLSLVRPRSRCPRCQVPLSWYENVPVFSFLLQGGRCRHCRAPISWRYPAVEVLTGLLVAILFLRYHQTPGIFLAYLWLVLILVSSSFIDIEFRIIPDEMTFGTMALAPVAGLLCPELYGKHLLGGFSSPALSGLTTAVAGILFGGGLIYLVGVFGKLAFRKEAMGFGDVKFMAGMGGFLGWDGVLITFGIACFAGSVLGLAILLITRDRYMPFGPYLSLGAAGVIFFRPEILALVDAYLRWLVPHS